MSQANECDRCGVLYVPSFGAVSIGEIGRVEKKDARSESGGIEFTTWSGVDLCPECGQMIVDILGNAINDVAQEPK